MAQSQSQPQPQSQTLTTSRSMQKLIPLILVLAAMLVIVVITLSKSGILSKSSFQPQLTQAVGVMELNQLSLEEKTRLTNEQWQHYLPQPAFLVLRNAGTELPYTGELLSNKQKGTYVTADCGIPVFRSDAKYDSQTGWPSFWQPLSDSAVELKPDSSGGIQRTEVIEPVCGSHLGHLFDDGPQPTGQRFCINSLALKFIPDPE